MYKRQLVVSVPVLAYAIGQLYRSIAIVHALAYHGSGRAVKLLPRSIGLFGLAVIGQAAAVNVATALSRGSILAVLLGIAVGVVSVSALWLGVTELFPHATASLTERIPGAVLYGVGTLALYLFNAVVIGWLIEEREDSYGALGAAAALLFSLYLTGRLIVASAALNAVVLGRRTHASS